MLVSVQEIQGEVTLKIFCNLVACHISENIMTHQKLGHYL